MVHIEVLFFCFFSASFCLRQILFVVILLALFVRLLVAVPALDVEPQVTDVVALLQSVSFATHNVVDAFLLVALPQLCVVLLFVELLTSVSIADFFSKSSEGRTRTSIPSFRRIT